MERSRHVRTRRAWPRIELWLALAAGAVLAQGARIAERTVRASTRSCPDPPQSPTFELDTIEHVNDAGGGVSQSLWWGSEMKLRVDDEQHALLCANAFGDCLMLRTEDAP